MDCAVAGAVSHVRYAAESTHCAGKLRVSERTAEQRKAIRRTALILVAVAVTFYLGFIMMGVLRA